MPPVKKPRRLPVYDPRMKLLVACRICKGDVVRELPVDFPKNMQHIVKSNNVLCVKCVSALEGGPTTRLWKVQYQCHSCYRVVSIPFCSHAISSERLCTYCFMERFIDDNTPAALMNDFQFADHRQAVVDDPAGFEKRLLQQLYGDDDVEFVGATTGANVVGAKDDGRCGGKRGGNQQSGGAKDDGNGGSSAQADGGDAGGSSAGGSGSAADAVPASNRPSADSTANAAHTINL
jgi:hypothetical protein